MRFIDSDEIESHCRDCLRLQIRTAKSGRQYHYCGYYRSPCFNVIDSCADRIQRESVKSLPDSKQKTLNSWSD